MQQSAEITSQEKIFHNRTPLRLELAMVERLVGPRRKNDERVMLDIGFPSPIMSAALRARGGAWCTIARSPEDARDFENFLETPAYCLEADGAIPFEPHSFDVVVVALDMLAAVENPEFFLRECNRVLKSAGEIIISAQFRKKASLVNIFRSRLADRVAGGLIGHSLTDNEIYRLMKPGFDVLGVHHFCGFFTEIIRLYEVKMLADGATEEVVGSSMRWKYWLAQQLDYFAIWRGYIATVRARRRRWRERNAPILADGRTLQEAVFLPEES